MAYISVGWLPAEAGSRLASVVRGLPAGAGNNEMRYRWEFKRKIEP